jgi:L-cystine uptake protein TcyP (sodium:dicarboxylate symporter family)
MEMIGRGEVAALEILKEMFGEFAEYNTQYPLTQMITEEYYELFTGRQVKETIDIVVFTGLTSPMAIRIQDKHHSSIRMCRIDDIQRQLLEENGWIVADVWHYECKELWKDVVNDKSRKELIRVLKVSGIDGT